MEEDKIINNSISAEEAEQPESLGFFGELYKLIYLLGLSVIRAVRSVFYFIIFGIFNGIMKRLRLLPEDIKEERKAAAIGLQKKLSAAKNETASFAGELKRARARLKRLRGKPKKRLSLFANYVKLGLHRHRGMFKTAANIALPVAAIIAFSLTASYWKKVTVALEVTYDDRSLGYIGSEAVYMEALDLIEKKIDGGAYTFNGGNPSSSLNAEYKLKPVSLDMLNDANTICDKVIESSASNLTNACGVYVDGEFLGAVKNEADAKTVFDSYLSGFAPEKGEDYIVDFVESIDYVEGLYSDNGDIIIDAAELGEKVNGESIIIRDYTVRSGDSAESIADENDMELSRLEELNPDYSWDDIREGDTVKIEREGKRLSIRKTVTSTENVSVDFDTIKTKDNTKYQGYEKVTRKGVKGINRVTTTNIYIDGELSDTKVDIEVVKAPVSELKTVGGKSYYGGAYVGSASSYGFLWPAPSCHYISSPYGYRRSGFHKGVDLCRSDGGANGTAVIAAKNGTVEFAGWNTIGYGNMVLINHGNGVKTRYAHMLSGSICVSAGEYVYAGQQIGRVGSTGNSTGPHLHFEVYINGERRNPMNYLR